MLRKLPLAMAIALAVMPIQSQALGLGQIATRSVLNQPFDAEIPLLSVPAGELDGVKVELASQAAFERAGVDRPFLLSRLRFETERKANGQAVIKIFSRQSIQEPFLNFLVEVNWPKGKMVREYTVLLDPPMTTGRRAAPVSTPAATTSAQGTTTMRAAQPERVPAVAADGQYGPVQPNETLWSIANRFRPSGVSTQQMMLAILEANPQAFSANNINTLRAGAVLRIPQREEITLTREQARTMADSQWQDWKSGLVTPQAAAPEPAEAAEDPAATGAQPITEAEAADESARLKLSGSDVATETGTGVDTSAESLKQELLSAQEKAATAESEVDELRAQMTTLQQQLTDMQRLIELKDEQLAQYQTGEVAPEDAMVPEVPMEEVPAEEEVMEPEAMAEEPAVAEVVEEEMPAAEMPAEEMQEAEIAEPEVQPVVEPEPEMAAEPEAKKEPGIVEMITGSATMMGIAVAVLVVLLALIWAAFSRRKSGQEAAPAVAAAPAAEAPAAVEPETQPLTADEKPDEETSFLSEFKPSDLDTLRDEETGEVDPISEADVYIAYGRFDEAEDLVKQALDNEPGKLAYQHKLLEIYYANKDQAKFTDLAMQMHEDGAEAEDPDGWNRAKLMGVDLDPENVLFADAMDVPSMDLGDDLDQALTELESQLRDDVDAAATDLNLTSEETPELDLSEATDQVVESQPASETLDLGALQEQSELAEDQIMPLPEVDLDASSAESLDEEQEISQLAAELESFDLGTTDSATAAPESAVSEPLDDLDNLLGGDDSLEDLSAGLDEIDDVTTKIDLARAYIEMGDKEGAQGILEEVLEEGSEAQKQEAQTLINEIS